MFTVNNIGIYLLLIASLVKCYELQKQVNHLKGNIKHIEEYIKK